MITWQPRSRYLRGRPFARIALVTCIALLVGSTSEFASASATPLAHLSSPKAPLVEADRAAAFLTELLYNVTFEPQGLPAADNWSIAVNGSTPHLAQGNTNVTLPLGNGTYSVSLASSRPYALLHPQISVTVSGQDQTVEIPFNLTFTANFNETGLPIGPGSKWHIFLDYLERSAQAGQPIQITNVTNGTHIVSSGASIPYTPNPQWVILVVNGSAIFYNFSFTQPPTLYNVTFNAVGLPPNPAWSISVDGRPGGTALNQTAYVFREDNGSHVYSVSGPGDYVALPQAAEFFVNGLDLTIQLRFAQPTNYRVSFTPSGLGNSGWTVTLDTGRMISGAEGVTLTTLLANGSYSFTVSPVADLTAFPDNGTFYVAGANLSVSITFFATHGPVIFTELGLPIGDWWVELNGENLTAAAGNSITVELPFGTYTYSAGVGNASYTISEPRGTLVVGVEGQTVTLSVLSLANQSPESPANAPATGFLKAHVIEFAVGGVVVALVLLAVVWMRYRPPRGPAATPPAVRGNS